MTGILGHLLSKRKMILGGKISEGSAGEDSFEKLRRSGNKIHIVLLTLPVSAGFGVAERSEAQATSGRAKVGRGCEA